ncbi:uncharacterized protein LOC118757415 [Rhagoletis pomonella]|uniref:uncharacterized protein LOC118757415 n=1 Tax=Rhagoletis pomonella TaxID=28610 RepID=UPI00177C0341|nr:uncharacterized protein LOC118757415 [Rhagoletis pomonella]
MYFIFIIQLFPKESKDTYYLYKKCKKPSGNLYAHYHNSIYQLRKAKVSVNPEPAKLRSSLSLNLDKNLNTDLHSNENEAKNWLKNNIEPYDKVVEYWNVTYETRQKLFNSTITTNDILIEWPILKQQFGYFLIELDFEKKYPLKSNCLLEEWDNLVTKLIPRFNNYAKDKYGLQLLEKLTTNIDKNARDVIVSLLLHSMLKPTHRKKNKKTTLFESREAFLIHAATRQELQHKILEGINKCKAGETVQPHLCGIGEDDINLTEFYIFFANSYYKVGNFMKSIDVCLKLFATLDLEYPAECKQVWEFLAKYFFNLTHENLSCVSSLISDLS